MASALERVLTPVLQVGMRELARQGDAAVLEHIGTQPPELWLEPLGGLRAALTTHPQSAERLRQRLNAKYGPPVVDRMVAADARILQAIRDAREVRARLTDFQRLRPPSTHDVAFRHLERSIDAHRIGYFEILGAYSASEVDPAPASSDDEHPSRADLAMLADMLWDSALGAPAARAAHLMEAADDEQSDADVRRDAGLAQLGKVVAYDQDEGKDVKTGSLLAPQAGLEDEDEAIAVARVSGAATVVVKLAALPPPVPPLYFVCALDRQLEYDDITNAIQTAWTTVVPKGTLDVAALTTTSGYVLYAGGGRYWGALELPHRPPYFGSSYPASDPGRFYLASARLAALQTVTEDDWTGEVFRPSLPLAAIFYQTVLDYTLVRLAETEYTLMEERRRFKPPDSPLIDPAAGKQLKQATAQLKEAMYLSAAIAWGMAEPPTEVESEAAQRQLEKIGRILSEQRTASAFVDVERDHDDPPEQDEFKDLLAGKMDGDAALAAIAVIDQRLDAIVRFRRHLFLKHPDGARKLEAVYPDVFTAFTDDQINRLRLELHIKALIDMAPTLGLGAAQTLLLALALVVPPAAIAAGGLSAALGVPELVEGFEVAQQLTLMANLDVPGGFTLASPAHAASARRWAWVGLGLSFLDVLGLKADVTRRLRAASGGRNAASALAKAREP